MSRRDNINKNYALNEILYKILLRKKKESEVLRKQVDQLEIESAFQQSYLDSNAVHKGIVESAEPPFCSNCLDYNEQLTIVDGKVNTVERKVTKESPPAKEPPDLCTSLEVLLEDAHHWENIGIFLKVQEGKLKCIEADNCNKSKNCLREMLREWLNNRTSPHTWKQLASAVKPLNPKTAEKILAQQR